MGIDIVKFKQGRLWMIWDMGVVSWCRKADQEWSM